MLGLLDFFYRIFIEDELEFCIKFYPNIKLSDIM